MGKKGRKWKESVPCEDVMWVINHAPISVLYPVAKRVCGTDYAVSHYRDENHPLYYHQDDKFRKALRRCLAQDAFDHRAVIVRYFMEKDLFPKDEPFETYCRMISENKEEIINKVNRLFEDLREYVCTYISILISDYFNSETLSKYEVYDDGCPWDHSGEKRECGSISQQLSVREFLNEYTGNWTPTHESGYGRSWNTFNDEMSYDTLDMGSSIMWHAIEEWCTEYGIDLDTENKKGIAVRDEINDDIFSESISYDFFDAEGAIDFCPGMMNKKISDIIKDCRFEYKQYSKYRDNFEKKDDSFGLFMKMKGVWM